jgi:Methylamine utilisation protein MauE
MIQRMMTPTLDPAIACLIIGCTALLFGAAAVHKLRDLRRFDEIFAAYGLLSFVARLRLSRLVPILETLTAAGLLFSASRSAAAGVGIVLLVVYAAAITINLLRGRRDLACGCGGPDDRRPIAAWMVWRNLGIAALLGILMLPWSSRSLALTDVVTIGFGTITCALVYLCLDTLLGRTGRTTAELRMPR